MYASDDRHYSMTGRGAAWRRKHQRREFDSSRRRGHATELSCCPRRRRLHSAPARCAAIRIICCACAH